MTNLRNAEHIYRMGGDEFLAIYRKTDEKTVIKDIRRVQEACARGSETLHYTPELAIGYADQYYHAWTLTVLDGQEVFFDPTAALDAIDAKNYSVERMY